MSRVYLALTEANPRLPKLVVAKVLLADLARDTEFVEMFFDEARLSARLDHPNVVKIFDVQPEGDEPHMLLEYLDGASLEALVRRSRDTGGMPLPLHLHAIAQAAHGLHYAHDLTDASGDPLRIVHRDVSPHNVFVTFEGTVKVLDFGVAKAADSSHTTKTGVMKGKFAYMAPEQVRDSKRVDRRVDVYALGVMLWQAATKRRPWTGLSEIDLVRKLLKEGLPPAESTPEAPIDDALLAIIDRATASDRDARYSTAAEFVFDLERYLATLPEKAGPRRLGAWASELMVERRRKISELIDGAFQAPPSSPSLSLSPPNSATNIPSLTPTPASSSVSQISIAGAAMGTGSHVPAPPPSGNHIPVSLPSHPDLAPASTRSGVTNGGTALMQSSTFERAPGDPRSTRTDQTSVSALGPLPEVPAPTRHWSLIAASAAIGASILVIAIAALTGGSPTPPPAKNGAGTAEPSLMTLSLSATPTEAKIFLDGAPLVGNPTQARLPRDGSEHKVRVEANGYRPAVQTVKYDEPSKSISIILAASH